MTTSSIWPNTPLNLRHISDYSDRQNIFTPLASEPWLIGTVVCWQSWVTSYNGRWGHYGETRWVSLGEIGVLGIWARLLGERYFWRDSGRRENDILSERIKRDSSMFLLAYIAIVLYFSLEFSRRSPLKERKQNRGSSTLIGAVLPWMIIIPTIFFVIGSNLWVTVRISCNWSRM